MKQMRCLVVVAGLGAMSLLTLTVCLAQAAVAAKAEPAASSGASAKYIPPKTPWGAPDLQGVWTSDDLHDVPMQRPAKYGTRRFLTEQEWAAREKDVKDLLGSENDGVRRKVGYFGHAPAGVEAAAVPQNWVEFARRASHLTSLVEDPPDGRIPALTPEAEKESAEVRAIRRRRPESWLDISTYDRCITRGVAGSMLPVIYGNGTQIIQAPGEVAIRYEMVHDTRIIPLDGRPHAGKNLRTYMGDAGGPLGGQHAGGGNHEFSRRTSGHRTQRQRHAALLRRFETGGAIHAHQPNHHRLPASRRRSEDLYRAMDHRISDHA